MTVRKVSFFLLCIFCSGLLFFPTSVSADGALIYRPDPYSNRWDFATEKNQQAFITYSDGIEKLIVTIQSDQTLPSDSIWLLPVPSDVNKVVVDVLTELPVFYGEEVDKLAKSKLDNARNILLATQIYPIPYVLINSWFGRSTPFIGAGIGVPNMLSRGPGYGGLTREQDVQVVEHLEKEGMTTEVITAKTARGLYDYFESKNLTIQKGSIPVIDEYIGEDYSFVASWSNQPSATGQKAIYVTFPTKKIYFPLLPTSVYGSTVVPATIRITGHVSPNIFKDIKPYTRVKYYVNNDMRETAALRSFWSKNDGGGDYTKIELAAPSKLLSSDLWIAARTPLHIVFLTLLGKHPNISVLILLILISVVSSVVWALALFPASRSLQGVKKYILLGLTNCLTLGAFVISTLFVNTKNKGIDSVLLVQLKQKGYVTKRKVLILLLLLSPFFWVTGVVIQTLLLIGMSSLGLGSFYGFPMLVLGMFLFTSALFVIVILVFVFTRLMHAPAQDQPLFDKLKMLHISAWTFLPKDSRKMAFIPLFSLTFIVLSLFVLKLVENTNAQERTTNDDMFQNTYQRSIRLPSPTRYYPTPTPTTTVRPNCFVPSDPHAWCANHAGIAMTIDYDIPIGDWSSCQRWCDRYMNDTDLALCQYNFDGPRNCWINHAPGYQSGVTNGDVANCLWQTTHPPKGSLYAGYSCPSTISTDQNSVMQTPTLYPKKSISATKPCPTGLQNGLCVLPNCSYTYPNDIYTPGHLIVGTKYKPDAKEPGYYYDECTPDNRQVKEMVCTPTTESDFVASSADFVCPNGCSNGACIE